MDILGSMKTDLMMESMKNPTNTVILLRELKKCAALMVPSYKDARYFYLKEKFDGKEPMTAVTIDVLQRYNYEALNNMMFSLGYSLNEKALYLVYRLGDTFKSLFDFVSYMKGKFSKELQDAIRKLLDSLFRMVVFLERFRDFLQGKKLFQSIFSVKEVRKIDRLIAGVLPAPAPYSVEDIRNWCVFEQVYVACDNLVWFVDILLIPFLMSCL